MYNVLCCSCNLYFLAVGAEVVLGGAGQWMVSEGTQTGEDSGLVQINVPLQQVRVSTLVSFACILQYCSLQLMQRVESFKALKRQQVDMANRLEFYCTQHTQSGTY